MAGNPRYEGGEYEGYGQGQGSMGSEFGEAAGKAAEQAGQRVEEAKQRLGRLGSAAKDVAYQLMENLRQAGAESAQRLEDRIQAEPLKSVLIAGCIGLGIGFALGAAWAGRDWAEPRLAPSSRLRASRGRRICQFG